MPIDSPSLDVERLYYAVIYQWGIKPGDPSPFSAVRMERSPRVMAHGSPAISVTLMLEIVVLSEIASLPTS